jgi:hypothetical protein
MCLNDCTLIIFNEMPKLSSCTCFWMYFRNARLNQQLISIMEKMGTPARYMAIAAPDHVECVPTSEQCIPNFVLQIAIMPSLSRFATISEVMLIVLFLCWAREMGESLFDPLKERICITINAQSLTGHMMGSNVPHCVTVSNFLSFFLSFESDRNSVCQIQSSRCVIKNVAVFNEDNVAEAKLFCLTFFSSGNFGIFAQSHCPKVRGSCEFCD